MPVHYEKKGKIGYIKLEGRGPMNVFSPDTIYKPLYDLLTSIKRDQEVRVVVISGQE
jgi:enoyl-CoA hydratase/carnithine racemase